MDRHLETNQYDVHSVTAKNLDTTGKRLNHLLDLIGFHPGHGRVKALYDYLCLDAEGAGLDNVKYNTVRAWFEKHAPRMRKIDYIIDRLNADYIFRCDIEQLKIWWKVGGVDPFQSTKRIDNSLYAQSDEQRMDFIVMAKIADVLGKELESTKTSDLVMIRDYTDEFVRDFSDPSSTDVPVEYIEAIVKYKLSAIKTD